MRSYVLLLSPLYREAIRVSLPQQAACALICLLLLDGGRTARVCAAAMFGFWAGVALVMVRRPGTPDPRDIAFIRWGFLPLFIAAAVWATRI